MKKLFVFALFSIFILGALNTYASKSVNDVKGEWEFTSPNAPYGYNKGTIIIAEKEGTLTGEIKFAEGYKIDLKKVSHAGNEFSCSLYVDYELVEIKANIEGKNMTGTADSSQGKIPFTAKKTK